MRNVPQPRMHLAHSRGEFVDSGSMPVANSVSVRMRGVRAILLLGLLVLAIAPLRIPAATIKVISSPEHAAAAQDRDFLRALFTMRIRQWPDGQPARIFVFSDSNPLQDEFCREILGTYPYVLRAAWDRLVFTGTGLAPVVVKSVAEMQRRVADTPGAIGYVPISSGTSTSNEGRPDPARIETERHE